MLHTKTVFYSDFRLYVRSTHSSRWIIEMLACNGGYGKWANIKRFTNYRFICIRPKQQNRTAYAHINSRKWWAIAVKESLRTLIWSSQSIYRASTHSHTHTHGKHLSWLTSNIHEGLFISKLFEWVFKYRGFCQRNWMFSQQIYDKMFIICLVFLLISIFCPYLYPTLLMHSISFTLSALTQVVTMETLTDSPVLLFHFKRK